MTRGVRERGLGKGGVPRSGAAVDGRVYNGGEPQPLERADPTATGGLPKPPHRGGAKGVLSVSPLLRHPPLVRPHRTAHTVSDSSGRAGHSRFSLFSGKSCVSGGLGGRPARGLQTVSARWQRRAKEGIHHPPRQGRLSNNKEDKGEASWASC